MPLDVDVGRSVGDQSSQDFEGICTASEGRLAGQDFVQARAECVDVGRDSDRSITDAGLFGRHVRRGPDHVATSGQPGLQPALRGVLVGNVLVRGGIPVARRLVHHARQPPVEHVGFTEGADHHVGRLEIAVHHVAGMGVGHRLRHADEHVQEARSAPAGVAFVSGANQLAEGFALDLGHREVVLALWSSSELVDGDHAGVLEPAGEAGFGAEARASPRGSNRVRLVHQDLHRQPTLEAAIEDLEDLAVAAAPELVTEFVLPGRDTIGVGAIGRGGGGGVRTFERARRLESEGAEHRTDLGVDLRCQALELGTLVLQPIVEGPLVSGFEGREVLGDPLFGAFALAHDCSGSSAIDSSSRDSATSAREYAMRAAPSEGKSSSGAISAQGVSERRASISLRVRSSSRRRAARTLASRSPLSTWVAGPGCSPGLPSLPPGRSIDPTRRSAPPPRR